MNNDLIEQKSWWTLNFKWFLALGGIIAMLIIIFFISGMNNVATDLSKAYTDVELYKNAIKKANANVRVAKVLGRIGPIDKLAILEGQVAYSNNNKTVNSSIRIDGKNGKATMDISAELVHNVWNYMKINIRIKNPPANRQIIDILSVD